jgi:hypothetical protein
MDSTKNTAPVLDDVKVHVKLKLSALWVAVMLCYIYGDFIGLFKPGKLQGMLAGQMPLGPTTQGVLLGIAIVMAIPSVMVFLSLVLKPKVNRWANIIVGILYTAIMCVTWYAWRWPSSSASRG